MLIWDTGHLDTWSLGLWEDLLFYHELAGDLRDEKVDKCQHFGMVFVQHGQAKSRNDRHILDENNSNRVF